MTEESVIRWEKWIEEEKKQRELGTYRLNALEIDIFIKHIRFLQGLISDLKQESTAYGIGFEEGKAEGKKEQDDWWCDQIRKQVDEEKKVLFGDPATPAPKGLIVRNER